MGNTTTRSGTDISTDPKPVPQARTVAGPDQARLAALSTTLNAAQPVQRVAAVGPSGTGVVQRHVTFDPYLKGKVKLNHSGLAGYSRSNIGNLADELIKRHGVKLSEEQIIQRFAAFLDEKTICFRDFADAAEWLANGGAMEENSDDSSDEEGKSSKGEKVEKEGGSEIDPGEFLDDIAARVGEGNRELVGFYMHQLTTVMGRLERGAVGVRYLTLNAEQRRAVLKRLIQAMIALGKSQRDPIKFFAGHTVILHGSYLFGASSERPGDIDVIISGGEKYKSIGISGRLDREPRDDKFTVGQQSNIVDHIVGIPFSEGKEEADLADDSAEEIRDAGIEDLQNYLKAAYSEKDAGKQLRKFVNIAVTLDYMLARFKIDSGLKHFIGQANKAIVRGKMPVVRDLAAAVEKAFKLLRKTDKD